MLFPQLSNSRSPPAEPGAYPGWLSRSSLYNPPLHPKLSTFALLPLIGFHGAVEELDVLELCVKRELLEALPEFGGHLEVQIDKLLR